MNSLYIDICNATENSFSEKIASPFSANEFPQTAFTGFIRLTLCNLLNTKLSFLLMNFIRAIATDVRRNKYKIRAESCP